MVARRRRHAAEVHLVRLVPHARTPTVQGQGPGGQPLVAKILSETADSVVLDHNHPLAGEALTFEVEIIEYDE